MPRRVCPCLGPVPVRSRSPDLARIAPENGENLHGDACGSCFLRTESEPAQYDNQEFRGASTMQHALQLPEIVEWVHNCRVPTGCVDTALTHAAAIRNRLVCRHVYLDSRECILDPPLLHGTPRALGVSTLLALCSVNRLFYREATPYLYRHVSINLPASFEAIVGGVGVLEEEAATPRQSLVSKPGSTLTNVSLVDDRPGRSLHGQGHATLTPNVLGPHEIESPPASREPSLDRGRGGESATFSTRPRALSTS